MAKNLILATKLKMFLDKKIKMDEWKPRNGLTYCNRYALYCLLKYGYDILPISKFSSIYTETKYMSRRAVRYKVQQITPAKAQESANCGEMILILSWFYDKHNKKWNHAAIVYPTYKPYNEKKGVRIIQAGGINGVFWISKWQAWGKIWRDERIMYLKLEKKG